MTPEFRQSWNLYTRRKLRTQDGADFNGSRLPRRFRAAASWGSRSSSSTQVQAESQRLPIEPTRLHVVRVRLLLLSILFFVLLLLIYLLGMANLFLPCIKNYAGDALHTALTPRLCSFMHSNSGRLHYRDHPNHLLIHLKSLLLSHTPLHFKSGYHQASLARYLQCQDDWRQTLRLLVV